MACNFFNWKRGQTFGASCTYVPETGGPVDLTGVTITSSIKDSSRNKAYPLTVTVTDPTHFTLTLADTTDWQVGTAYWDIRFAIGDVVFYSETVAFNVVQEITPAS